MQSGANAQGKDIRTPIANVFAVKKESRLWWFHRRLSSDQCVTRKRKDIRALIANVFPSDLFTRTLLHWIYAAEFLYRRAGCESPHSTKNPSANQGCASVTTPFTLADRTAYPIEHPAVALVWNSGVKIALRQRRCTKITPFMMGYANSNTKPAR